MFRRHFDTIARLGLAVGGVAGLYAIALPNPVWATPTTVQVTVYDGKPATLTIDPTSTNPTSTTASVIIRGRIHNVSQILVYIDGKYSHTVSFNTGSTDFEIPLKLASGQHVVKLVAINPYDGTKLEQSFPVTYTPQVLPTSPSDVIGLPAAAAQNVVATSANVAAKTNEIAQGQINLAAGAGPMKDLSDRAYTALLAADLISVTDGTGLRRMLWRCGFILLGLILIIFPWSVYRLFRVLRLAPYAAVYTTRITTPTRLLGVFLVALPFVILA